MWHGIHGHDDAAELFRQTLASGRLASTYLFVGPSGIGKRHFAMQLAQALLCIETGGSSLDPCGQCESCRLFLAGNHPDLEVVSLPPDKTKLPIELFVGDREHRQQEGLCHRIALKPFLGQRRVAIIDDADLFSQESANCLLKTLEEPPPRSVLILIGTSPSRQLPTIRSRAQIVRFRPLSTETVAQILTDMALVPDRDLAKRAAELSEGSVARAVDLADPALWTFRGQLFTELASPAPIRLARAVQAFIDEAGKEPAQKRERLRTVIGFAIAYFRHQLYSGSSGNAAGHNATAHSEQAAPTEGVIAAIDACLAALEHVDRNANLGLVIQAWSEELAQSGAANSFASAG